MVLEGFTVTGDPLKPPGFHTNVVPAKELVADNEVEAPGQMFCGYAVGETPGLGFTVTLIELDPEHPAAKPFTV